MWSVGDAHVGTRRTSSPRYSWRGTGYRCGLSPGRQHAEHPGGTPPAENPVASPGGADPPLIFFENGSLGYDGTIGGAYD